MKICKKLGFDPKFSKIVLLSKITTFPYWTYQNKVFIVLQLYRTATAWTTTSTMECWAGLDTNSDNEEARLSVYEKFETKQVLNLPKICS